MAQPTRDEALDAISLLSTAIDHLHTTVMTRGSSSTQIQASLDALQEQMKKSAPIVRSYAHGPERTQGLSL